jgi:GH25 family lysozyme M1 (1,4-beta-N-acetylmuramidase)
MEPIRLTVVDMYHGDRLVSFARAKQAGILGIIHKASEGAGFVDPKYARRRQRARRAGLLWGAYHFGTSDDVAAQVDNFLAAAAPDAQTLVALDYEENGAATMSLEQARQFLIAVEGRLGRKAVLYSGDLIKEQLGDRVDPFFGSHRLWLAEYGPVPRVPPSWSQQWLWQYSGDGIGPEPRTVPGIPGAGGAIDCNSYEHGAADLAAQWAS